MTSSLKVPYDLRPSKQIERRMFLEMLNTLSHAGFNISKYHYVGFGSIFFYDFRIFHKYGFINEMTSIESSEQIIRRCRFNKPFNNVKIFNGLSSDFLKKILKKKEYLIWFDYDFGLDAIVCEDAYELSSRLKPGSIVILTIDLELGEDLRDKTPADLFDYFKEKLPDYSTSSLRVDDFRRSVFENTLVTIIKNSFNSGIVGRSGVSFQYFSTIKYADGHEMLTIVGMVVDEACREKIAKSDISSLPFVNMGTEDEVFKIPKIIFTKKELLYLEKYCPDGERSMEKEGISNSDFEIFRKFYRYWPSYFEVFI